MAATDKPCLLVVDDEPEVCDSVFHLLRRSFTVLRAHGAGEAMRLLAEHEVHIIMTDQRMPVVSGVAMLERVKCEHPEAIRLLFTGYSDIRSVIEAINQGHVYRYLTKPWEPEQLEAAVADAAQEYRRLVDRSRALALCRERVARLEEENRDLRARLGEHVPPGDT